MECWIGDYWHIGFRYCMLTSSLQKWVVTLDKMKSYVQKRFEKCIAADAL